MMMMISVTCRVMISGPKSTMIHWLLRALVYYNCLLTFCFHELDLLIERDDLLCNIHGDQEIPIFNLPPRNCTIDELSEEDVYALTRLWNIISVCWWFIYKFHLLLQLALDTGLFARGYWLCAWHILQLVTLGLGWHPVILEEKYGTEASCFIGLYTIFLLYFTIKYSDSQLKGGLVILMPTRDLF